MKTAISAAPPPLEAQIQRAIMDYLLMRGWEVLRLNAGLQVMPGEGTRNRRVIRGAPKGTPDLLALKMGHAALFVEVKRPGKKATPVQEEMMGRWRRAGAQCMVATSVDDVQAWGI